MTEPKRPISRDAPAFICEACGEVYATGGPEAFDSAEATYAANKEKLPGHEDTTELAVVCDPCWKKFSAWYELETGVKL